MTGSTSARYDVVVVGAGIVGLAQAYEASRRGLRTIVFERSARALGASIRNFGMVWPIGQPAGALHRIALRSRELWIDICRRAGIWHDACGSVYLVTREDELAVLREFCERGPALGYSVEFLGRDAAIARSPVARADAVIGGMFSPSEVCVESPAAIAAVARWLAEEHGVEFRWSEPVTRIDAPMVQTVGSRVEAARILVCSGADFEQLYPETYARAGVRRCKLQMLAVDPSSAGMPGWKLGPMIASGLTLRHYQNFDVCPSLGVLKERVAREQPELDRYGIHVMASQHSSGELILGDSHEYDADISPFDKAEIEARILEELQRFLHLPTWKVSRRWSGIYAKLSGRAVFVHDPEPGVRIVNATGGSGMTMSLGLAEHIWEHWNDTGF